jgi:hypothetical protein
VVIGRYDLERRPWTWDFYTWLVTGRANGMTAVDFKLQGAKSTKWSMDESLKRFWNYLEPGPRELAGMQVTIDGAGQEIEGASTSMLSLPERFERLELVYPAKREHEYTVTLRDTFHRKDRNSNVQVWRQFAKEIGAHVIDDSRHHPITLRERYTFYANARMNYGVPNGPFSILWYTKYPMCMFSDPDVPDSNKAWTGHGVKPGQQLPWFLDNQKIVWEKATVKNLMQAHRSWTG